MPDNFIFNASLHRIYSIFLYELCLVYVSFPLHRIFQSFNYFCFENLHLYQPFHKKKLSSFYIVLALAYFGKVFNFLIFYALFAIFRTISFLMRPSTESTSFYFIITLVLLLYIFYFVYNPLFI